ncbi:MAG TPA: pantetheine-phosphate adenylyltransferase [Syntrophomonas sp.]|nr:pantetheine-phosphate adenylyltransferase [Syntrophomonas sp.]
MATAVYPGSFDPVTMGHIDILERTSRVFDKIVVAVVHNVTKEALFTLDERVELIKASVKHLPNVEVECFNGLLADFLKAKNATVVIRGLRSITDFEYESHMSMMNKKLLPEVDTVFIMSNPQYIYVSSSGIKEAALLGGNVSGMVPAAVERGLKEKLTQSAARI